MFDIAWSHILLISVVALLVIGPKDLPRVLRTVGIWVGRARAIAREFQGNLDQMIREAELEEVRKEVEKATTVDLGHSIETSVDPDGELKQTFAEPPVAEPPVAEPPAAEPPVAGQTVAEHTVPQPELYPEPEAPPAAAAPAAEPPAAPSKSGTHD